VVFEQIHEFMNLLEITQLPEMVAPVSSEADLEKVHKLVDLLEDHDDVQSVYTNAEIA
jgi:transcriptional/translational regulatory protein YebC/TACO1